MRAQQMTASDSIHSTAFINLRLMDPPPLFFRFDKDFCPENLLDKKYDVKIHVFI